MGVHEAYHLDPTNRLIHWLCIPLELTAVLKLLAVVPAPVDLGLVAIVLVGAVYVAADLAGGAAMVILLLGLACSRGHSPLGPVGLDVVVAVALVRRRSSSSRPASGTGCSSGASTTPR